MIDKQPAHAAGEGEEEKNEEEEESKHVDYPKDQDDFVFDVLKKFLIGTESSFLDSINLILMLKALPSKIVDFNLDQMLKFDFSTLQNSLIASQNAEQVNAFEYFDEKNKDRVQKIRSCILDQKDDLNQVETIMGLIK